MINIGGGLPFFLGILLVLCGVALYALRSYRPQLARDHDIFFAAISAISGFILMFQGWQLNPILQLGQIAVAGSAVFFAVENIRLRGITTEQAKRSSPLVDDDRPVSRDYDYEEDYSDRDSRYRPDYGNSRRVEPSNGSRRISGRSSRPIRDEWDDGYRDAPRRMPARQGWDERPQYAYDDRYNDRNDRYGERYDNRPPKRRLTRAPHQDDDSMVMDATWDEAPHSVQEDSPSSTPREDYKRDYRAIPPSRRDSRDRIVEQQPSSPSYSDEAPVVNANYANYRPTNSDSPDDGEEDNSGYQNFY